MATNGHRNGTATRDTAWPAKIERTRHQIAEDAVEMMRAKLVRARKLARLIQRDLEDAERAHVQAVACCKRIAEICRG